MEFNAKQNTVHLIVCWLLSDKKFTFFSTPQPKIRRWFRKWE